MAKLIKDFRGARAAIDLAFNPDVRLVLDSQYIVIGYEFRSAAGETWWNGNGSPVGKEYELVQRSMDGLVIESICF